MHTLADCQIVVARATVPAETRSLAALFEQAGARVRDCSLGQDLWACFDHEQVDAVLVWMPAPDADALALFEQARGMARERGALTCLLTEDASAAASHGAFVLEPGIETARLVQVVSDLLLPVRRLHELQEQQGALRRELQHATAEFERLSNERAEVAHESRSMLSAIMGFASNLRDELPGPLTEDQHTHVAGILEAVERATGLLERARSGSAPRTSQPPLSAPRGQRVLIPLARLTGEVLSLFDAVAKRKRLSTSAELDETVSLWGEPLKLKQVVTNLLVNALRYTPAPGHIHVRVAWSAPLDSDGVGARRHALLEVSDTGPGVAPTERELIFQRGYRAAATRDIEGEGIGLAVVKDIVSLHGGSIEAGGEVGKGATFSVLLPQDRRQRALAASAERAEIGELE